MPQGRYESVLVDLVHNVDSRFATRADRGGRVLAGLSSGAYAAINVGLHNLKLFGNLQCWSGYFVQTRSGVFKYATVKQLRDNSPADYVGHLKPRIRKLGLRAFIYVGNQDHQSRIDELLPFAAKLRAAGATSPRPSTPARTTGRCGASRCRTCCASRAAGCARRRPTRSRPRHEHRPGALARRARRGHRGGRECSPLRRRCCRPCRGASRCSSRSSPGAPSTSRTPWRSSAGSCCSSSRSASCAGAGARSTRRSSCSASSRSCTSRRAWTTRRPASHWASPPSCASACAPPHADAEPPRAATAALLALLAFAGAYILAFAIELASGRGALGSQLSSAAAMLSGASAAALGDEGAAILHVLAALALVGTIAFVARCSRRAGRATATTPREHEQAAAIVAAHGATRSRRSRCAPTRRSSSPTAACSPTARCARRRSSPATRSGRRAARPAILDVVPGVRARPRLGRRRCSARATSTSTPTAALGLRTLRIGLGGGGRPARLRRCRAALARPSARRSTGSSAAAGRSSSSTAAS